MHITKVEISNFRSIRKLSMRVGRFSVLAGENNAGKSNVLRALDLFFNVRHEIHQEDFNHDTQLKLIVIKVGLDNIPVLLRPKLGLPKDTESATIHFRYSKLSGRVYKVRGQIIDEKDIRAAFRGFFTYVPPLRDIEAHLNAETGNNFSKLVSQIIKGVSTYQKRSLRSSAQGGFSSLNALINRELRPLTAAIQQLLPNIEPRFVVSAELVEVLSLLRLQISEHAGSTPTPIEKKGHGFHSLVVLAMYSHAMQKNLTGGVLAIEEPELHLHPNLQRQYAVLMRRFSSSKRVQIMCTTHSTYLINQVDVRKICKISKSGGSTKAFQPSQKYLDNEYGQFEKNLTDLWSELLLTRFVLLVEGPSEGQTIPKWASRVALTKGSNKVACTFANHSIGIYRVGSSTNFQNFMKFLKEYKTPFAVLTDADSLERGSLLAQLRSAGVISHHEQKIYSTALKNGKFAKVIQWLRRKMIYIAERDFEDMVVDQNSKAEVERVIREFEKDEYEKFIVRSKTAQQILDDFRNQTVNRIGQFKQRLGIRLNHAAEPAAIVGINTGLENLFNAATAAGDVSVNALSDLDLIRRFIKRDKVLWHIRIARGLRGDFESKAMSAFVRDLVTNVRRLQ
jgi:predicted ATPase